MTLAGSNRLHGSSSALIDAARWKRAAAEHAAAVSGPKDEVGRLILPHPYAESVRFLFKQASSSRTRMPPRGVEVPPKLVKTQVAGLPSLFVRRTGIVLLVGRHVRLGGRARPHGVHAAWQASRNSDSLRAYANVISG
jgi:hypothetical protein